MDKTIVYGGTLTRTVTPRSGVRVGCFKGSRKQLQLMAKLRGLQTHERAALAADPQTHWLLKDDVDAAVRLMVAEHTRKYDDQFVVDPYVLIRETVAAKGDSKYHKRLVTDSEWQVRARIASVCSTYHAMQVLDEEVAVRLAVAKYNTDYHEQFVSDVSWEIRRVVIENSPNLREHFVNDIPLVREHLAAHAPEFHHILCTDEALTVRIAVALASDKYDDVITRDVSGLVEEAIRCRKDGVEWDFTTERLAALRDEEYIRRNKTTSEQFAADTSCILPEQSLTPADVSAWTAYEVPDSNYHIDIAELIQGM